MHTISGSLSMNDLLALPSEYASEDIPNKDYAEEDNFPISHDDAYDGRVLLETLHALADEESPTSLPADSFGNFLKSLMPQEKCRTRIRLYPTQVL